MKVRDVMSKSVVSVAPEDSFERLARLFNRLGISGAPVVDATGRLVGVVSKTDLIRGEWEAAPRGFDDFLRLPGDLPGPAEATGEGTVGGIMSHAIVAVDEDDPVERAAALMDLHRIHRVLVTRQGRLSGVLSSLDLLKLIAGSGPREA